MEQMSSAAGLVHFAGDEEKPRSVTSGGKLPKKVRLLIFLGAPALLWGGIALAIKNIG